MDNLTMNVIEAHRAGMSYGQWKAKHPHTRDDEPVAEAHIIEKPTTGRKIPCAWCGREFVAEYSQSKYCCVHCRIEADRKLSRDYQKQLRAKKKAEKEAAKLVSKSVCKIGG